MTDRTAADDIAAIFREEAAPVFAEHFHADRYQIVRVTTIPDGSGGSTEVPVIVEEGRCALIVSGRIGNEAIRGGVVASTSYYVAELPYESDLTPRDTLYVNGRKFDVVDVKRGGDADMFTMAELEERG